MDGNQERPPNSRQGDCDWFTRHMLDGRQGCHAQAWAIRFIRIQWKLKHLATTLQLEEEVAEREKFDRRL
jgi:hypothetical protein